MNILLALCLDVVGPARLPRLFHDAGGQVTLFSPSYVATRRSRFVDRHVPAPDDPAAFTEQLRCHLAKHGERYQWVQSGDETVLRSIAARFSEDWTASCLPVPRTERNITLTTDKLTFLAAARDAGLPVPKLVVCSEANELAEAVRTIRFPLMLKRGEGMSGSGVRYVASIEDLTALAWECTAENPLMVQTFLRGPIGSTDVLFDRGRPGAWLSSYHREFWPNPLTASCVRELADVPEMEDMLIRIGAITEYHGLAGIDWLRNQADGRIYLIELNPRPTPCYHLGRRVGVNFATALRGLITDQSVPQRPHAPTAGEAVIYQFPQYCYRAIDDRAFHRLWMTRQDIPWSDPLLAAAHLRRVITHYSPSQFKTSLKRVIGR